MSGARPAGDGVTVVGGGLAGMTAAWHIRRLGIPVRLLEAAPALGGMAGSRTIDNRVEDHGVHIFPAWYRNTLQLVDELGISGNLRECETFHQLLPGEFPRFRSAVTPVADRLLFHYGVVDLLAQRYEARDESLHDFLRSRWYLTEAAIADVEHLFVASSAAESHAVSAAGFRGSIAAFARHPGRVRMPRGDLEQWFIGPFQQRLAADGVGIRTGTELLAARVEGDRLGALTLRDGDTVTEEDITGHVVLAIPHGAVRGLGPAVTGALRPAHGVEKLRSRPLGALHLYLRRRLPGLPDEHVRLVGSPHALTLVDVGQVWEGHRTSLLNCVVGRVARLAELPEREAVEVLVAELRSYLPTLSRDDIEHVCYQPHYAEPFFAPGPGSARHRPESTTALANLHLAGDYCAAPPGVAGMESAVRSGLTAAESVRRVLRPAAPPVPVRRIGTVSPQAARCLRTALTPLAATVRLLTRRRRAATAGVVSGGVGTAGAGQKGGEAGVRGGEAGVEGGDSSAAGAEAEARHRAGRPPEFT
ncbi:FAD-dependent oxidoreductase [Streptomyces oryzae]|uniref:FAD-dependent oxidoreductase n=1 Tax=Streptomyces oryzae TaxID=1434886 RepID=A0ABS3XFN5_9ACTN|nr:FAD-dependent oxidoreductase [Streptomyces oryzae]MBO8193911.1 FAD-dependent oxidoreductase [Streptomyces oryzae]